VSIVLEDPTWARAYGYEGREAELRRHLSYRDMRADYEYRRLSKGGRQYIFRHGEDAYRARLLELKEATRGCLLREEGGRLLVPSGVAADLARRMDDAFEDRVAAPDPRTIAWRTPLDRTPRPYQEEAARLLLAARHGGVELGVGLGKTLVSMMLVRELGLRAVVASPFSTIVRQTHREFERFLGKSRVGQYGDGKKEVGKLVTVATAQSLARVEPGSEADRHFRGAQVLVFDESHMCAADVLSRTCQDLMAAAPYRFFLSGTQMRTDGLQKLLDGITGPILMRMSVEDGVRQGYLARPAFRMVEVEGGVRCSLQDPQRATREVLYRNPRVIAAAARTVNSMARSGRQVLVLVDELDQYASLVPHLAVPARFAHGSSGEAMRKRVPQSEWRSDVLELVDQFNDGRFPVLVGTSCVGTGVDVRAASAGVYLMGGRSEIGVRQGVGRLVRLHPGKSDSVWVDFDVVDNEITHRHAEAREAICRDIFPDFERMRL
jgi:superfamily II DNA or RNA helicase